jgi:predicted DsbA family dithiol-disulfide isomerase
MQTSHSDHRPEAVAADYFSDVLCVWAYAGQARIDTLMREHGDRVAIHYRFLPLFGDVAGHLEQTWGERGGARAFADHVHELAQRWDHVRLHPEAWRRDLPPSSFSIHRLLKAVQIWESRDGAQALGDAPAGVFESVVWRLRRGFFEEALDIGRRDFQDAILEEFGLSVTRVRAIAENGQADAALIADVERSQQLKVPGSPTLVLNEGRQLLYGDIGYGVVEGNIEGLIQERDL